MDWYFWLNSFSIKPQPKAKQKRYPVLPEYRFYFAYFTYVGLVLILILSRKLEKARWYTLHLHIPVRQLRLPDC